MARTRKSSSEEKARLSAKMAENRELKKQVSQKQGARNDEILDREVRIVCPYPCHRRSIFDTEAIGLSLQSLITHLKTELIKEKEK